MNQSINEPSGAFQRALLNCWWFSTACHWPAPRLSFGLPCPHPSIPPLAQRAFRLAHLNRISSSFFFSILHVVSDTLLFTPSSYHKTLHLSGFSISLSTTGFDRDRKPPEKAKALHPSPVSFSPSKHARESQPHHRLPARLELSGRGRQQASGGTLPR